MKMASVDTKGKWAIRAGTSGEGVIDDFFRDEDIENLFGHEPSR